MCHLYIHTYIQQCAGDRKKSVSMTTLSCQWWVQSQICLVALAAITASTVSKLATLQQDRQFRLFEKMRREAQLTLLTRGLNVTYTAIVHSVLLPRTLTDLNKCYLYIVYTAWDYIFVFSYVYMCVFCILFSSWMLILALSNEPLQWMWVCIWNRVFLSLTCRTNSNPSQFSSVTTPSHFFFDPFIYKFMYLYL